MNFEFMDRYFNPSPPTMMCLDINSCFATIEQQANPLLRGKPVAVVAYTSPGGCILAASVEAKRLGVKTGMRVAEGRHLCPQLVVLPSDPAKYRFVNRKLLALLMEYTADVEVKSIDEMVLNLKGHGYITTLLHGYKIKNNVTMQQCNNDPNAAIKEAMIALAKEIKQRIRTEIGEWITVSIGIAPNRYLAKVASGLHKPDGLEVITGENIEAVFSRMTLEDLCGIKQGYAGRLRQHGIKTTLDFYRASAWQLVAALHSIVGYHWWRWLHGWEAGNYSELTRSVGHSYALYKPYTPSETPLHQILCQLTEKMGKRLRSYGARAAGIHLGCLFVDYSSWQRGRKLNWSIYTNRDLYLAALQVLSEAPDKPVRIISVSCYRLAFDLYQQMSLLSEKKRQEKLTQALDAIDERFGDFTVFPARMLKMEQKILDRIAFGKIDPLDLGGNNKLNLS